MENACWQDQYPCSSLSSTVWAQQEMTENDNRTVQDRFIFSCLQGFKLRFRTGQEQVIKSSRRDNLIFGWEWVDKLLNDKAHWCSTMVAYEKTNRISAPLLEKHGKISYCWGSQVGLTFLASDFFCKISCKFPVPVHIYPVREGSGKTGILSCFRGSRSMAVHYCC